MGRSTTPAVRSPFLLPAHIRRIGGDMPVVYSGAPYHQQDGYDFCGQAVAQMVLGSLGRDLGDQRTMRRQASIKHPDTTPEELCLNLNPASGGADFGVCSDLTARDGVLRISGGIAELGPAVPALVLDGGHWIAVTGVSYDGDPSSASSGVMGFFIHDPEPQNPRFPCPESGRVIARPHQIDDTCGIFPPRCSTDYGSGNTFVTMYEWLNFYWRSPSRRGTFVSIRRGAQASGPLRGSISDVPPQVVPAGSVLSKPEACVAAMAGIERYGLRDPGSPLAAAVAGVEARPEDVYTIAERPGNGQLGSSEPYYLVMLRRGHEPVANVRVGCADGRFLSLQAPRSDVPGPSQMYDFAKAALARYASQTHNLDVLVIPDRRYTLHPTLVWRPCRQSMSPFYPFVQINLAGSLAYASLDGRVHSRLERHR